jgi:hypothetical protein
MAKARTILIGTLLVLLPFAVMAALIYLGVPP